MDAPGDHDVGVPDGLERGSSGADGAGGSSRPDILLVEDNPGDVALFQQAVDESHGRSEIHVARTGDDALSLLDDPDGPAGNTSVDIVVLDLDLPGTSGLSVLKELKRDPATRAIPVLVLSTSEDREEVQRAYELGANAYMVKRMRFGETVALVDALETFWLEAAELPD